MSEDIRMSDVFEFGLCLEVRDGRVINRYDEFTQEQADVIEDAVDQHDKLTDRVKELEKAADALLWECLSNKDVQDSKAWRDLERLVG